MAATPWEGNLEGQSNDVILEILANLIHLARHSEPGSDLQRRYLDRAAETVLQASQHRKSSD